MEDITLRALNTLRAADVIACEDTRHSALLLNRYEIKKPLVSYHKHNEKERTEDIIKLLDEGKAVAVISDAGMPCVSDPGAVVVTAAREKGHTVTVIPGPSAVVSAVSLAGIDTGFVFIGFLPDKLKSRTEIINNLKGVDLPLIFYASPHDLMDLAAFLLEHLGGREVYIVKEITKVFESVIKTSLDNFDVGEPRGEYVVIVMPMVKSPDIETPPREQVLALINSGIDKKEAIKRVAKNLGVNKNEIYQSVMDIKE